MRKPGITAAAVLLALAGGGGEARAQPFTPRTEYERLTERPKPVPQIPAELRTIVTAASPDRLIVRRLDGQPIPVDVEWYEPEGYLLHRDGRYLGFPVRGYEAFGYILVDRAGGGREGAVIETGQAPAFSADGRHFAAAEMSDAGFGNLEGLAVWEVLPDRTVRRFFTDAVPHAFDWRVDRWLSPSCVSLSAVGFGWQPPGGREWEEALRDAPRSHFSIDLGGGGVTLRATGERMTCAPDGP